MGTAAMATGVTVAATETAATEIVVAAIAATAALEFSPPIRPAWTADNAAVPPDTADLDDGFNEECGYKPKRRNRG